MTSVNEFEGNLGRKLSAWGVHLFTASGVFWGFLAILAIQQGYWISAFFWMALAVAVDSFDGMLARLVQVKKVLPNFDGALLDNMVDYFNYTIVPAYLLYHSEILPTSNLALVGVVTILMASAYQFSVTDAKTEDHYFKGFPSYWNIAVFYMLLLKLNPWFNFGVTILLGILVFVPIKYIYPSRTTHLRGLTLILTAVWGVATILAIFQFPEPHPLVSWITLIYVVYYVGLSLYDTFKTRTSNRAS
jgi:phosphatidylcholine synthase